MGLYFRQKKTQKMKSIFLFLLLSCFTVWAENDTNDFPVEVQADILLTEFKKHSKTNNWEGAANSLEKLLALKTTIPNEFHYHFAKSLMKANKTSKSLSEVLAYLQKTGDTGKYAKEAEQLFILTKNTKLKAGPLRFPDKMSDKQQAQLLWTSIKYNETHKLSDYTVVDYTQLSILGVELPKDFDFFFGRALFSNAEGKKAKEKLGAYMKSSGREGIYYKDALALFVKCKDIIPRELPTGLKQQAKEEEIQKREEVRKLSAPELLRKSQMLLKSMQWAEALDTINTALTLDDSLDEGWYLKGQLFFGDLKFNDALDALRKSNIPDQFGLKPLAEDYEKILAENRGSLSAIELRQLSRKLRKRNDEILSNRIQQLALDKEREILARLNLLKQELKELNPKLVEINYKHTISGDTINVDLSSNIELTNISPLSGLPITELNLAFTNIFDIKPLLGMPLKKVHLPNKKLTGLDVIRGMRISELHLHGKPKQDFNFINTLPEIKLHLHLYEFDDTEDFRLQFLKLVPMQRLHLYLHGDYSSNLTIFISTPLTHLSLVDSMVTDISPLRYQELTYLDISNTRVKNLRPLRSMPLEHLSLEKTRVRDIKDLEGKPLKYLSLKETGIKQINVLTGMPIQHLDISQSKVTDFSILGQLPLKSLYLENLPLIDLQFLEGTQLTSLSVKETYIDDIGILKGMPLTFLDISGTKVADILDLERMRLVYLALSNTSINDITMVKGMPLRHLDISNSGVTDISPLTGMHLNSLSLAQTQVSDITPLQGMPIKELSLAECKNIQSLEALAKSKHLQKLVIPVHIKNIVFLRDLPSLKYIGTTGDLDGLTQTTEQFWTKFSAKP